MKKTKNKHDESIHEKNSTSRNGHRIQDVDFVLETSGAERVYLCGDFNDWQPASLRMIGNPDAGLWQKRLSLPSGRYEYKFNVDGRWIHDPGAQQNVTNAFGSLNSVLEVSP
jgi:1,4-alpha-glucan branching enzyme